MYISPILRYCIIEVSAIIHTATSGMNIADIAIFALSGIGDITSINIADTSYVYIGDIAILDYRCIGDNSYRY